MDNSIPEVGEEEGNGTKTFPTFGNKEPFPQLWNRKGKNRTHSQISGTGGEQTKAFPKFGNGKEMKKSIPIIRERESEAFILGNGREQEFPLTPGGQGGQNAPDGPCVPGGPDSRQG